MNKEDLQKKAVNEIKDLAVEFWTMSLCDGTFEEKCSVIIAELVKKNALLAGVSKCDGDERRRLLIAFARMSDSKNGINRADKYRWNQIDNFLHNRN